RICAQDLALQAFAAGSGKQEANGVTYSVRPPTSHRSPAVSDCVPTVALFQVAGRDSLNYSAACDSGRSGQAEKAARKPTQ
ncbi:MAG: hypothetical protein ACKO81_07470, partial [Planctomycetota bacterium]